MRIDIDTSHVLHVTLSRRNVETLLRALEDGDQHLTLNRSFGPDTKGLVVAIEDNDVHYAVEELQPETYCKIHDLFDCWLCPHLKG